MAFISRGQITIVDLSDGKSINLYLGNDVALTQIYNKENSSYTPNWAASPFLIITPDIWGYKQRLYPIFDQLRTI